MNKSAMRALQALALLSTLGSSAPAIAAEASAESVLNCMRGNMPPTLRLRDIELVSTDKSGAARSVSGRVVAMREPRDDGNGPLRAKLTIDKPANLKGASYLIRQTDDYLNEGMWVYLPSVKRVRRVTGTFADGSLLGTDFSYEDFKQLESVFDGAESVLAPDSAEKINERAIHVLNITPKPQAAAPGSEAKTVYSQVKVWVDQQACLPVQAEFMEGKTLRKRLTTPPGAIREAGGGRWYLSSMEMTDLRSGSKTSLRVLDVSSGTKLSPNHFDPKMFYLGN